MHRSIRLLFLAVLVAIVACAGGGPATNTPSGPPAVPSASSAAVAEPNAENDTVAAVPIGAEDPTLGESDAPVTIVEFADFECPYCARASTTLERILKEYASKVRLVFKHEPLPTLHPLARSAAEAAVVVHSLGGNAAFWSFYRNAYNEQNDISEGTIESWVQRAGVALDRFRAVRAIGSFVTKLDRDHQLARLLKVDGTPTFFINGIHIGGAQKFDVFKGVIDAELEKAARTLANGVKPPALYWTLSRVNFGVDATPAVEKADEDTTTVWRVPIDNRPTLGSANALVTIVEFADFQCPYCKLVEPTLKALRAKYGDQLRFVWRNEPLAFHAHAEPSARFALEARAQKGDAGFWDVHDRLFAISPLKGNPPEPTVDELHPNDADFDAIARAAGLDLTKTHDALAKRKYQLAIDEDLDLVDDFSAVGTPHFFINGRRLVGAHDISGFTTIIDEEVVKANALLQRGVARAALYDELVKAGKPRPALERRSIVIATNAPSRGAANAPVTIVEFGDLECQFCRQVEPTLADLLKSYAGKVRLQWRHYPLAGIHPHAPLAAEAAAEVFVQKGSDGFWKFHDRAFAQQDKVGGLEREALEKYAAELGVDMPKFRAALDGHVHASAIKADGTAAIDANVAGTPSFFINGFYIDGAQSARAFRRRIDAALVEAAAKKP